MNSRALIPITLVTGFLGSGKTTFLMRLAENHPRERLLFLVNEFAPHNIDGETLIPTGCPIHSVVGGSLFCECKAADFVRLMHREIRALHSAGKATHVVIETSGIANPSAIGRLMHDHGLDAYFEIRQIVNIIAPQRFPRLLKNLPSVRSQVQACNTLIINQTDLATADQIERSYRLVAAANPTAQLISADHCNLQFDLNVPPQSRVMPRAPLATSDSNPFTTATVTLPPAFAIADLRGWLQQLPPAILRVKGRVNTSAGWREVQRTVDGSSLTSTTIATKSQLVIIAHDRNNPTLNRVVRELREISAPSTPSQQPIPGH